MTIDVTDLCETAFAAYAQALTDPTRVTHAVTGGSMPILYFGDLSAYWSSALRIITVGLNPSQGEFPLGPLPLEPDLTDDPWQRFPAARGCSSASSAYRSALDNYFRVKPLTRWFGTYSHMLDAMDASFGHHSAGSAPPRPNTALHTDLCTPVPTTPTWSGLLPHEQAPLARRGRRLWRDLAVRLRPDVILLSVGQHHLRETDFADVRDWDTALTFSNKKNGQPRRQPYVVRASRPELGDGHRPLVLWGRAANTPFGTLSNAQRAEVGRYASKHAPRRLLEASA